MVEHLKCGVCGANPQLQGAIVSQPEDEGHDIICGLHLTEDGKQVNPEEVVGDFQVLTNWGFGGATPAIPLEDKIEPAQALILFDKTMERILQNGGEGWGWKIVVGIGDTGIEASTFPKGYGGSTATPSPTTTPTGNPESVANAVAWRLGRKAGGGLAPLDAVFAYAFLNNQDKTQIPEHYALKTLIDNAGGTLILGDFEYVIGGDQKNLLNRRRKD